MTSIRKKLSIRIRRNRFFTKFGRNKKGNKVNYRGIKDQLAHDFRDPEIDWDTGYLLNSDRFDENKYLGAGGKTRQELIDNTYQRARKLWIKAQADYKMDQGRSLPSNTSEFLTGVLSFSRGFEAGDKAGDLVKTVANFIKEEFSQVVSVSYHQDELSGHIHFSLVNYDFKNHKTIGRNLDTSNLQDKIAAYLQSNDLDFGHTRGDSKQINENNNEHLEIMEAKYKYSKELDQEIQDKQNAVRELNGLINEQRQDLNQKITDLLELGADSTTLERRLKTGLKYADSGKTQKLHKLLRDLDLMSEAIKTKPIRSRKMTPF